MATGDADDVLSRLEDELPPWFADSNPILSAVLAGIAAVLAAIYTLYTYAKAQTRLSTATDIWLDLFAYDFFGTDLMRDAGEQDAAFRARIVAAMFAPKCTRAAISASIESLTGYAPKIVEPFSPADCGAYSVGYACYGGAGAYGSVLLPAQVFITAYRPQIAGIANVAGYGFPEAGYSIGSQSEWADISLVGGVSDAQIYAALDLAKAAGIIIWARITSHYNQSALLLDGLPFTLDGDSINL